MIYTDMTKLAMKVCFDAHKEQTDKAGIPYVFHPIHLAEQMDDEDTTAVALLHDVIEDSPWTIDELGKMGFNDTVLKAIEWLTHDESIPYMEYVKKIKENPVARAVKLADLRHNSDLSRLNLVDEKSLARVEKYKKAIQLLENDDP